MSKNVLILAFCMLLNFSCSRSDTATNNPFLSPLNFSYEIDLNLPQYNALQFVSNHVVDQTAGRGIQGVVIYNINNTSYSAFELSDPNRLPSNCSVLEIDGIEATADCGNGNVYEIVNGQRIRGEGEFSLLRYNVRREGNVLFVSN